jgi:hypothetical protein
MDRFPRKRAILVQKFDQSPDLVQVWRIGPIRGFVMRRSKAIYSINFLAYR